MFDGLWAVMAALKSCEVASSECQRGSLERNGVVHTQRQNDIARWIETRTRANVRAVEIKHKLGDNI